LHAIIEQSARLSSFMTRERVVAYSRAALVGQLVAISLWVASCWLLHHRNVPPPGIDFRVFWSASFVSLHQGAMATFNPDILRAAESTLLHGTPLDGTFAPWVYPPTFEIFIYPLALLPYPFAYALFSFVSLACCLVACAPLMKDKPLPWVTVIAFPGIWVTMLHGQNSLLTFALAAAALRLRDRRPIVAGACAGLLFVKPQLAPIFPLLFLVGRHYKAFAACVAAATLLCLVSVAAFGTSLWLRFFETASLFKAAVLLNNGDHIWNSMPTVFAIARQSGLRAGPAYVIHALVALSALACTVWIWFRKPLSQSANAAAITTALLIPPYLLYYDLSWLLLPVIYICIDIKKQDPASRWRYAAVGIAWSLPLASFFIGIWTSGPQWSALALPVLLIAISHRATTGPGYGFFTSRVHHHVPALLRHGPEDDGTPPGELSR
jgi:hypothetical protein